MLLKYFAIFMLFYILTHVFLYALILLKLDLAIALIPYSLASFSLKVVPNIICNINPFIHLPIFWAI